MPVILAGGANGALTPGRRLVYGGRSHTSLLMSILEIMGLPDTPFGHPAYDEGPLIGLA